MSLPPAPQVATVCPLQVLQNKINLIEGLKSKINQLNAALVYALQPTGTFRISGHKQNNNASTTAFTASPNLRDLLIKAIQVEIADLVAQHDAEVEKLAAIQKLWS